MKINKYDIVCEKVASYDVTARVKNSDEVGELLLKTIKMDKFSQERFYAIMVNAKGDVVGLSEIGRGTTTSCPVSPADVFRAALNCGTCVAVIVAHNHPTGALTPSKEDIKLTKKLVKAGKTIGIKMLDHFIIANGNYYSMKAGGDIA